MSQYHAVETLGAAAIYGYRSMTAREIQDTMTAKSAATLVRWYKQREMSGDWGKWAEAHTAETRALEAAHKEYEAWLKT